MYMAGERPDAQCLARHVAKPTKNALKNAWHTCSYLFGTGGYGVRLEERRNGQSTMDFREVEEVEDAEQHLVKVVTDSDHAGNKNDRKSTTSMQVFIDGNLIDSKVRSQKAIVLSSGESEFMALVAGCSEGMLVRHLWNKITGGECQMKARAPQIALRTQVVLPSRKFSSSSSPATLRTRVVLQSRQCSSSSSPNTPRTQVVLPSRQFSSSHSPATPRTTVVLPSRQFSSSSSPATPRTTVVLQSRQFSASSSTDCSAC